ncbi:hypothetical protein AX774_g1666 [Zancudomyces culisetae]|uniref:Uncharacterized protein n=1 Tax=Zancudomyces culisetae TaxID=1213189 RepID=A0A1R1PV36_ZANCU|nr:hypothetical protein AX774_g1666 [Zancudomyces culisetae]|eukprot:OMH84799.1 hypothetical protein AX774_g1666 [Zancudomyces culisetae]
MLAQRADGYKDRRKMSNGSSMFVGSSEYAHPQSYLHVSPKLQNSHGPTTGRLSVAKNAFELNQYRASMSDSTARAGSATVADFQTDFLQLQTTIAKQDAEIAKLNFTIDNLNNSLNTLSFENKALNSNSSALQSLQAENQRLSKLVHSYEATISHLNNSLTSAELLAREQEYSYNRAILAQKQLVHEKDLNLSALSTKIEYLENSASILRKNLLADLRKAKVTQDIQDRVLGLIDICENFKP